MKRLLFAATILGVALVVSSVEAATILNRIGAANAAVPGASLTFEDDSREILIDIGNDGINDGDILIGFAKINTTSPPSVGADNQIYAIFSQTFQGVTVDPGSLPGTQVYTGGFTATTEAGYTLADLTGDPLSPNAMIAFMDRPNGTAFSFDGTTDTPASMTAAIAALAAEGVTRFTAGVVSTGLGALYDDFFRFESELIPIAADPFANPALIPQITTSQTLGSFGAGLSIVDNFYGSAVIFNDILSSNFNGYGALGEYQASVSGGTFTGSDQVPGAGINRVQGGFADFLNNADFAINAQAVVPEPTSLGGWCFTMLIIGGVALRRRRK